MIIQRHISFSSWLRKERKAALAFFILILIVITAILAPALASHKPLYINYKGNHWFPVFTSKKVYHFNNESIDIEHVDWSTLSSNTRIMPLVPYSPGMSDLSNADFQSPLTRSTCHTPTGHCSLAYQHWLGTNLKGEDVLSGILHGASASIKIGFFSILVALAIGLLAGMLAGYYGDKGIFIKPWALIAWLFSVSIILYSLSIMPYLLFNMLGSNLSMLTVVSWCIGLVLFILVSWMFLRWGKTSFGKRGFYLPIDTFISRGIEVFTSIPKLMLIISLSVILERSVTNVILVLGITSWTGIARIVRAEVLKYREMDFTTSARSLGFTDIRIMWKHIFPNILPPVFIACIFGVSGAIMAESGLSFLNMGVPEHVVTWGQLLADAHHHYKAWWLIVFPAGAILITLICLQTLAQALHRLYGTHQNPVS